MCPTRQDWVLFLALCVLAVLMLMCGGCSIVSNNRVFPKLTWYWTNEAKEQRASDKRHDDWVKEYQRTNTAGVKR